jgi:hypothetical protein
MMLAFLSIAMQVVALVIIIYAFKVLSSEEEVETGIYTKYFLLQKRYELLKASLVIVAVLTLVQTANVAWSTWMKNAVGGVELIVSDIVLIGVVLLLTKIYSVRSKFLRMPTPEKK